MQNFCKISISRLSVNIPEQPFGNSIKDLKGITQDLKRLSSKAGMDNEKFKAASKCFLIAIEAKQSLAHALKSKLEIRALGFFLSDRHKNKVQITPTLLDKIDLLTNNKPSTLFVECLFQYYLNEFNQIDNVEFISKWLTNARQLRNLNNRHDQYLISPSGPKWLAELSISQEINFDELVKKLNLDKFRSGQYMECAQRMYYIEQLKVIPVNQPHDLLIEVQNKDVFNTIYNGSQLLGHQILNVLINKVPAENIHESWMNVIMAIAGDPRIPTSHPRYMKWWSKIENNQISKVKGWLSRFDLKLFLEALEDFSNSSNDFDMRRMYPSRKQFLEGLYNKKLIQNTRLYMSSDMSDYLKRNYKAEHLPNYSIVKNNKSIIYVDLDSAHLVEGSHSCYLWIYKSLDSSATVFDYNKTQETYTGLTAGLNRKMEKKGCGARAMIQHKPVNFNWQIKAVDELKNLGVDVKMKDVLTTKDYSYYLKIGGGE